MHSLVGSCMGSAPWRTGTTLQPTELPGQGSSYIFHLNVKIGSNVGKLFFLNIFKLQASIKSWRNSYLTPPSFPSQPLMDFPSAVVRPPERRSQYPLGNVKE